VRHIEGTAVLDTVEVEETAVSSYVKPTLTRWKKAGESTQKPSGKNPPATSGKLVANPEVETSGKSIATSPPKDLPLTADTDDDIELGDDVSKAAKGWRLEENSDGYWRWRWQLKDDNGDSVTYVNKAGNVVYKRGCEYVPINKLDGAKEDVAKHRKV
jgi:hypothetical protein